MKKRIISLCMVVCLLAVAIVGGTMAYFTDTKSATNTMTIGDVSITLEEKTREGDAWVAYNDATARIYPMTIADGYNEYNKLVVTTNTSTTGDAAYIRTIVLFEKNDKNPVLTNDDCCLPGLHFAFHDHNDYLESNGIHGVKSEILKDTVTVNNEEYHVVVFTEVAGKTVAKNETVRSMYNVWMDENITDTDAQGWGDKVDVIALSQAIQAEGLTHAEAMTALGEINGTNLAKWLTPANS